MGFYLFIRRTLDTLALFSSQGELGGTSKIPLYPDFCFGACLVRGSPRDSLRTSHPVTTTGMSHEEAEPHNMGFYLFISERLWTPLPYFPLRKIGQGCPNPSIPDFCIALLRIAPRFLSGRPLSNYNKAMSHEEAEPHNMGFLPLHSRRLWDLPLPYFPLRENWAKCQNPSSPISA